VDDRAGTDPRDDRCAILSPAVLAADNSIGRRHDQATGKQWYWTYSYPDSKFEFDSLMLQDKERKADQPRLLAVDNEIFVPVNKVVHVQVTGAEVIHSFVVPAFGVRIDAVPGRLNETWFKATREGVYYGQCSELCGKDHAYMPIAVRVVSDRDYAAWIEQAKKKFAKTDTPAVTVAASGQNAGAIGDTNNTSKD